MRVQGIVADAQFHFDRRFQRHRLFHMDGTVETTRILGSRSEAVAIVEGVLTAVETGYTTLIKPKGKP